MVVTLRHVAEAAGVHPGTASRALNNPSQVNAKTVARVRRVAARLGYVPNPNARGLKTSRSHLLGVVVPDLTNPLFPPIIRGIDDTVGERGFSAVIVNTDTDLAREVHQVQALRARQVDGLLVCTAMLQHPLFHQLQEEKFPLVYLVRTVADPNVSSVTGDDAAGLTMIVDHLVQLGHRHIAHIGGPQDNSAGVRRLRAFESAMRDRGLPASEDLIVIADQFQEAEGAIAARRLLDGGHPVTAIVAANDLLALGTYDALADRGLHCPSDVSVTGFNDMPFLDKISPPLTSINVPRYEIGAQGARLLLEALTTPTTYQPRSVQLPVQLVVRASTTVPAAATPTLARQRPGPARMAAVPSG
jgi:LacI family transcriptional regulator